MVSMVIFGFLAITIAQAVSVANKIDTQNKKNLVSC